MPVRPTGLAGPLSSASLPRNPALSIDCNEGFGLYLCWGKHSQKLCSSLLIDLYQWALWGEFQIKQEGRGGGTFFIYLFIFFPAMHICTLWFRHDNPFRSSPGKDRDWIGWKRELKTRAKKDRECVKEREGEEERGRERERDEGWMEIMVFSCCTELRQTGWNSSDQLLQLCSFVGVFRIVFGLSVRCE